MFGSICPCGIEGFAWLDKQEIFGLSDSACFYEHAGQRWVRGCVQQWQHRRVIAKWMREGAHRHREVEEGRVHATLS